MATLQDLATQVMGELALLPAGQTANAQDYATIVTLYSQRLLFLLDEDYADWDAASIPDAAMPGLKRVVAWEVAPNYNIPRSKLVEPDGRTMEAHGLAMLRRYMRMKPSYEETRADYF